MPKDTNLLQTITQSRIWCQTIRPAQWGIVIALVTALGLYAISQFATDREQRVKEYGNSIAQALAGLSKDPVVRQDRVHLGVLANQSAQLSHVAGVVIATIDNHVLASAGSVSPTQPDTDLVYKQPIQLDATTIGSVSITLDAAVFAKVGHWWQWLLSILVVFGVPLLVTQLTAVLNQVATPKAAATVAEVHLPLDPEPGLVVLSNLDNSMSLLPEQRQWAARHVENIADAVGSLYDAEVEVMPGKGVALRFAVSGEDAGFRAVCAGLAMAELLTHSSSRALFRTSGHCFEYRSGEPLVADTAELTDLIMLAGIAKTTGLAVSSQFLEAVSRRERVMIEPLNHQLVADLTSMGHGCYLISGLAVAYRDMMRRQVSVLLETTTATHYPTSTSNESTF